MKLNKRSLNKITKAFFAIALVVLFSFFAFFNSARIKACEDCVAESEITENFNSVYEAENEFETMSSSEAPEWMKNYYKIDDGLKTTPIFGNKNLLDLVEIGDLYYEKNAAAGQGHLAIITGIKFDYRYNKYYIELIENAKGYNVCYGMLDEYRFSERKGEIYKPKNIDNSKRSLIVNYLKSKLGTTYDLGTFNCVTLVKFAYCQVFPIHYFMFMMTPLEMIECELFKKIFIRSHSCLDDCHYCYYRVYDEQYHVNICYCGEEIGKKQHFTVNNGFKRYCKFCGKDFANNSPTPEVPFVLRKKVFVEWINKNNVFINNVKSIGKEITE